MNDKQMKPQLPDALRNAMAKAAVTGSHVSADLLTGYAEHALSPPETATVAEHLATCADCRQVMFLASSADDSVEELAEAPRDVTLYGWWRWAVPATAALMLVASFLLVRKATERQKDADQSTQQAVLLNDSSSDSSAARPAPVDTFAKGAVEESKKAPEREHATPPADALAKGKRVSPAAAPPLPAIVKKSSPLEVTAEAPPVLVPSDTTGQKSMVTRSQLADSKPSSQNAMQNAAPAAGGPRQDQFRDQLNQNASNIGASGIAGRVNTQPLKERDKDKDEVKSATVSPPASATQTAGFAQTVEVEARAAKTAKRAETLDAGAAAWRIAHVGVEHFTAGGWQTALKGNFQALGMIGDQVWAGASGPELQHSSDGGAHWSTVIVQSGAEKLEGKIKSITPADAAHITVVTEPGISWTSADGGKTWAK